MSSIAWWFGDGLTPRSGGAFGIDHAEVRPAADGSSVLRVHYPRGSASERAHSSDDAPTGGMQVYLRMAGGPSDAARLHYCVAFPAGFQFVKGGKLPGLYGGWVTSGRRIPDGTDGWSTRLMWRTGGAGEVYAYLPSSRDHGTSLGRGSFRFTPGARDCIDQVVVLNTPGRADGSVTIRLNGREVFRDASLVFRTVDTLHVDGLFFSTFFGGGDASWATPVDQYADFSDVRVTPIR